MTSTSYWLEKKDFIGKTKNAETTTVKKIQSYSSYAVSSAAFWFTHTSGYSRNSNMFLEKKKIAFLVSLLSVRKQRKEPRIVSLSTQSKLVAHSLRHSWGHSFGCFNSAVPFRSSSLWRLHVLP